MRLLPACLLVSASLAVLLPLPATAQSAHCRHSLPQAQDLSLEGVRTVRFEVGPHTLRVQGAANAGNALTGRACASSESLARGLSIDQQRDGDVLTVRLGGTRPRINWLGSQYAYLDLAAEVPDDVLVQLVVGSGDVHVDGVASASADVGSGDVTLRQVAGQFTAKVGSGDITATDIGALDVLTVGSGDIDVRRVRDAAHVGSIGSGDMTLQQVGGDVRVGSIGSGDLDIRTVSGSVHVQSIGSGDLDVRDVDGDLDVGAIGSGDVRHRDVRGQARLPRRR